VPSELLARMYLKLKEENRCQTFSGAKDGREPTSVGLTFGTRGEHIIGWLARGTRASQRRSASLTLWTIFQRMSERFPEIDLVGCNSPKRGAFKAGFGGTLKHYFVTSLTR